MWHTSQENNSSLGNAHHATHKNVASHVAEKLKCEDFSRQFVTTRKGSNVNATEIKPESFLNEDPAFFLDENHNCGYKEEPLPPPPSITPQNNNDVCLHPRYVTEIKLKIKNPTAVDRNESAVERTSIAPFITGQRTSSMCEREMEFKAVPGRAIRHEESFLPSPPESPTRPPLPRIPRVESINSAQLLDGFATFARKQRRKYIHHAEQPPLTKYQVSMQEINYPARLTYESHSPRGYQMVSDQFNLHAVVSSKSTPAIQTGDSSAATSIHELLHGSSLLNLENLLKAPGSFVKGDDESSTMALSSPSDSLEYTKCWKTSTAVTPKTCKTERRPPAHVGGEFNSCGIQVTATGLEGDFPGQIPLTKKTFSNVEVQTVTPLGLKGVEERGCGATPERKTASPQKTAFAVSPMSLRPPPASSIGTVHSKDYHRPFALTPSHSSGIYFSILHQDDNNATREPTSFQPVLARQLQRQTAQPPPPPAPPPPSSFIPTSVRRPVNQYPMPYTTVIAADSTDYSDDNVVLVDGFTTAPPPLPSPNSRKFKISPLSTLRQCSETMQHLQHNYTRNSLSERLQPTTTITSAVTASRVGRKTDASDCSTERPNNRVNSVSPCHRRRTNNGGSRTSSRASQSESQSPSYSESGGSCSGTCSCSSCLRQSQATVIAAAAQPPQLTLKRATPEKVSKSLSSPKHEPNNVGVNASPDAINLLSFIGDRHKRELLQRWLVNQVSANVAMRVGTQMAQKIRDAGPPVSTPTAPVQSHTLTAKRFRKYSTKTRPETPLTVSESEGDSRSEVLDAVEEENVVVDNATVNEEEDDGSKTASDTQTETEMSPSQASSASSITSTSSSSTPTPQKRHRSKSKSRKKSRSISKKAHSPSPTPQNSIQKSKNRSRRQKTPSQSPPSPAIVQKVSTTKKKTPSKPHLSAGNKDDKAITLKKPTNQKTGTAAKKTAAQSGANNAAGDPRTDCAYEKMIELSPFDELIRSHLNPHDRRIKAAAMKNGCTVILGGPIKKMSSEGPLSRQRDVYRLVVGATSKERADKCLVYLRDTFPKSSLKTSFKMFS